MWKYWLIAGFAVVTENALRSDEPAPTNQGNIMMCITRVADLASALATREHEQLERLLLDFDRQLASRRQQIGKPALIDFELAVQRATILELRAAAAPHELKFKQWGEAVQERIAMSRMFAPRLLPLPAPGVPIDPAVIQRRMRYVELDILQKRCSIAAFRDIGEDATKGDLVGLQIKFDDLAKQLDGFLNPAKFPDMAPTVKQLIAELFQTVPELGRSGR